MNEVPGRTSGNQLGCIGRYSIEYDIHRYRLKKKVRRHPNLLNVMAVTMVIAALSFVVHYWKYRCGRRGNLLYRNGTTIPVSGRFS